MHWVSAKRIGAQDLGGRQVSDRDLQLRALNCKGIILDGLTRQVGGHCSQQRRVSEAGQSCLGQHED